MLIRSLLAAAVFSMAAWPCGAQLYKYQKDGVWYFTDSPPKEVLQQSEIVAGSENGAPAPTPEGTPLLSAYPARNDIEKAVAATVAVKSGLGYGSGFFISTDGYILTNKHVIRSTQDQLEKDENFFGQVDSRIKNFETRAAGEKKRLKAYEANLEELERLAREEKDPARKKSYEDEYRYRFNTYQAARRDFESRRSRFESEKKDYMSRRSDYDYGKLVANLSQSFEIILADNTLLNARLVAISTGADLALLKVDGYKTPALKPASEGFDVPGRPLFAIGNPAKLKNSVTSGVFSGYENGFIKTNAQIYPGNSGGPLVTQDGAVAGINTFKQLTRKFEGLGFAIPIGKALSEFGQHLR